MKITPMLGLNGYKSKDGTYPLQIRVHIGQKRKLIPVGIKIKPSEWDAKACRIKNRYNSAVINMKIIELCNEIERNFIRDGSPEPGDKEDFYWWFEERLKFSYSAHSTYNYEKLRVVRNKLKRYAPVLPVSKLDYKFLLDYESHLRKLGNCNNTIADNMMRIEIIVNMIIGSGKLEAHKSPFRNYSIKTERSVKKRMKIEYIEQLMKTDFSFDLPMQLAVDMYLYSFFNAGIRFGDLCRIKFSMIREGRLCYRMHKNSPDRRIKQSPQALTIIDRQMIYNVRQCKTKSGHIFDTGVMWRKDNSRQEIYREDKHINSRNSFFNKKLKEACQMLEIQPVTFHSSRHSFADFAKSKKFGDKFDIHTLKDLLGHSKTATTEIYMQQFYEEESDQAMDQLFGGSAPSAESAAHDPSDNAMAILPDQDRGHKNQKKP